MKNEDHYRLCVEYIKKIDNALYEHCRHTAEYAYGIAEQLHKDKKLVYKAGLVHDIGKIATSPSILNNPKKLTAYERQIVDMHSYLGYCILKNSHVNNDICNIVLYHHGEDKPHFEIDEVPGEDVLYLAKILRCADVFDALRSERVYAQAISAQKALDILYQSPELDRDIVDVMAAKMQKESCLNAI